MKKKFLFMMAGLLAAVPLSAKPIVLNSHFKCSKPGTPDNWGKRFRINGKMECLKDAIKVTAKNDSFLDEATQFPVVPGALLKFSVDREGSGDVGFIVRLFNEKQEQIHLEVLNGFVKADKKSAVNKYTVRQDYKGKKAKTASVGLFFRKGADMNVTNFKCDYTAGQGVSLKAKPRTDWAKGTYASLTAKAAKQKNIPVMFLGDSITQCWEFAGNHKYPGGLDTWNEMFKPIGAVNYGVSGDTVQNVLWRVTEGKQLACKPRVIVLNIGTNNFHGSNKLTPKQIADGIDMILTEIKRQCPQTTVLLVGILPRSGKHPVAAVNKDLKAAAKKHKVHFLDVSEALLQGKKSVDRAIFRDGLHLSPAGYKLYGEQLRPVLRRLLEEHKQKYPALSKVKSPFAIYVANDASSMEKNAAKELQYFFSCATGKTPEIVSTPVSGTPNFVLGRSKFVRSRLKDVDFEKMSPREILLKRSGKDLILTGGKSQGTLFAVYEFVEKYLGVRFYSSTEIEIPYIKNFRFPEVDYRYDPQIRFRTAMYHDLIYTNKLFGVRLRNNGDSYADMKEWGCHPGYIVWCHSFDRIIPAKKYFSSHPEYFSDNGKGVRSGGQLKGQLCLTNPEVKKVFLENLMPIIREKYFPGARVSVSQNDNTNNCHCPKCSASDAKYGASGTILNFVNSIAAEVEKEFPDVIVETFAYQYSTTPPKGGVKPRHNVAILLCSIGANCGESLSAETNAAFRDELKGWKKLTDKIGIWSYVTNFENYMTPFPNLKIFAGDMKFLSENNVISVLAQGDWNGGGVTGDFVALRAWLFSKLMWDPKQDPEKLLRSFTDGYYGVKAAPFIRKYWELLSDEAAKNKAYVGCFTGNTAKWLSLDTLLKAYDLMEQAIKSAEKDNWLIRERILIAAQPIRIAALERANSIRVKYPDLKIDFHALYNTIRRVADRNNGYKYQENRGAEALYAILKKNTLPPPPRNPAKPSARVKNKAKYFILQAQDISTAPSRYSSIVDDPDASDGKAIRFVDKVYTWTPQYHPNLDGFPMQPGKYRLYLTIRAEAAEGKTGEGIAFEAGSYDLVKKIISDTQIPFSKIAEKYTEIDMGVHDLNQNCYLYFAPKKNLSVKYVYVDRLVIIPVKD